jgi:hypothetical protein
MNYYPNSSLGASGTWAVVSHLNALDRFIAIKQIKMRYNEK